MALYDYRCPVCAHADEVFVPSDQRDNTLVACPACDVPMDRQFPLSAIKGFQPFEPYYDESLDTNITGHRHKQRELKARGFFEMGDRQGGAINWEKDAPHTITKKPVRAIAPQQHRPKDPEQIFIQDRHGNVEMASETELDTDTGKGLLRVKAPDADKLAQGGSAFKGDIGYSGD